MIGIFKLGQFGCPKMKVLCSPCHQMQAQHGKSGNSSSCLGHPEQQDLKVPLTTSCCARAVLPAAKPINCSPVWQRCREGDAWAGRPAVKHMKIPGGAALPPETPAAPLHFHPYPPLTARALFQQLTEIILCLEVTVVQ